VSMLNNYLVVFGLLIRRDKAVAIATNVCCFVD